MNHAAPRRWSKFAAHALLLAGWLAACAPGAQTGGPDDPAPLLPESRGMSYSLTLRADPRPLRIHHLRIDLRNPDLELAVAVPPDPDGDGPAETALQSPIEFAKQTGALALFNASPWEGLPDAGGKRSDRWHVGMPVDVCGLAVADGAVRSPDHAPTYPVFWIDADHAAHFGHPARLADVRQAIAGFSYVLRDGQPLGKPERDTALHPRTALGLDATGRWLHVAVVDGRQPGFSEGMSTYELGLLMRDLGCHTALNLDGGGSSILLLTGRDGTPRIVNSPSNQILGLAIPRPLPDMLCVRKRQAPGR